MLYFLTTRWCVFFFSEFWQFPAGHLGPWRFPDSVSGWGMQQRERAGPGHCNPPAAAKPALGLGLCLQHPQSVCLTEGFLSTSQKPTQEGTSFQEIHGKLSQGFKLWAVCFALPIPRQTEPMVCSGQPCCVPPPVLGLLSLRKTRTWFRTINQQQLPGSRQGSAPNKEICHLGSCTSLSIPSLLPRQDFETANSGYEQLLELVFLSADEELISSISWFK